MSRFDLPSDMPQAIKSMILEARQTGVWRSCNMQLYGTKTLENGLKYLEKIGRYPTLQKELRHEISARNDTVKPMCPQTNTWFPEMWWAVISLFGKGEMDRNATRTKDVLSRIDPTWSKNCGARY